MANDKKFVVKNGLTTQNISFVDDTQSTNNIITVSMLGTDTLSFSGNSGQLFSITDTLSGTIFAVNDISGVPSIEVDDDGTVRFAETFGNILIGTATDNGVDKLQIDGSVAISSYGQIIDSAGNWVGPNTGLIGFTGSKGDQGIQGFTGSRGNVGFTGSQGIQGIQGIQGFTGSRGNTGFTGSRGNTGFTGSKGDQGIQGIQGFTGSRGATGFTGSKGDQGTQGIQGFTGSRGNTGFTGSQGIPGPIAGTDGQIVYNNNGSAGGSANLIWNDTTQELSIKNTLNLISPDNNSNISIDMLNGGTLSFEGTSGQLFSITDTLSGTIFSVNDISGIPSIEVDDDGTIRFAEFTGDVLIGSTNGSGKLFLNGADLGNSVIKTATYTAIAGDSIIANTTGGVFTITLPVNPSAGNRVKISDGGDWSVNPLTVARNGSTIEGSATDFLLDINDISVDFVYDGSTWQVYANVGKQGDIGDIGFTGSRGATGFVGSRGFTGSVGGLSIISNDTTTNATRYIGFVGSTSGNTQQVSVSSTKLFFNPATGELNATNFNSLSDIIFKENISTIDNAINTIEKLRGTSFTWKENQKLTYGVIAQEIEKIIPELISESDYKSVNYNGIIPFLIEAIKELNREIKQLRSEINK